MTPLEAAVNSPAGSNIIVVAAALPPVSAQMRATNSVTPMARKA